MRFASNQVYTYSRSIPFPVSEEERQIPEQAEKLDFLQDEYSDGFESYQAVRGLDDYGM